MSKLSHAPRPCAPAMARLALSFGLAVSLAACTAATPTAVGTGGGSAVSTGGATSNGSGGAIGSGGAVSGGTGGATGPGSGGSGESGGSVGSGGSAPNGSGGANGASGGSQGTATGGTTAGTGGRAGTGGSTAAKKGCWETADGNYAQGAVLNQQGKVVLFDGTNLNEWKKENTAADPTPWFIDPNDKAMVVQATATGPTTDQQSRKTFEDLCVHLEYMTPIVTSLDIGQNRGNSGVYLKSAYELQILDSSGLGMPDTQSCGAVYLIKAPYESACFKQEIWNTYEIEFNASKWNGTTKVASPAGDAAFISVTLNGVLVQGGDQQRAVRMNPPNLMTEAGTPDRAGPQPLMLQDHRWRVKFRNIWVKVPSY